MFRVREGNCILFSLKPTGLERYHIGGLDVGTAIAVQFVFALARYHPPVILLYKVIKGWMGVLLASMIVDSVKRSPKQAIADQVTAKEIMGEAQLNLANFVKALQVFRCKVNL